MNNRERGKEAPSDPVSGNPTPEAPAANRPVGALSTGMPGLRRGLSRRTWLRLGIYGLPALAVADSLWLEPRWLAVRRLRLGPGEPACRLAFFTDLHHKGDRTYLERVVRRLNALRPDLVCFGGDLVEEAEHLEEALEGLREIQAPLYGVPGNHDYWSGADFAQIERAFEATGGEWMLDRTVRLRSVPVEVLGYTCRRPGCLQPGPGVARVALIHYPAWFPNLGPQRFDAILAGHSHGGQVRLPFVGALIKPFGVGEYELGLYATPVGPLYVGAGIGWFYLPVRFRCRPEITLIELALSREVAHTADAQRPHG